MTASQFRKTQQAIGVTNAALAAKLMVHPRSVAKWRGGERPVPGPVSVLMGVFAVWAKEGKR